MTQGSITISDSQGAIGRAENVFQNFYSGPAPETGPEVPYLLPYMSDRSNPKRQFVEICHQHRERMPRRPLIQVVHGNRNQSHINFLGGLFEEPSRELSGINPAGESIHLEWYDKGCGDACLDAMIQDLSFKLVCDSNASPERLAQALAERPGHQVFHQFIYSKPTETAHEVDLLQHWLQWWDTFPSVPPEKEPLLFIAVVYPFPEPSARGSLFSFFRRSKKETPSGMRTFLGADSDNSLPRPPALRLYPNLEQVWIAVLSELTAVPLADVRTWALALDLKHCPSHEVVKKLGVIYQKRQEMPMDELGERLTEIMKEIMKEQMK